MQTLLLRYLAGLVALLDALPTSPYRLLSDLRLQDPRTKPPGVWRSELSAPFFARR